LAAVARLIDVMHLGRDRVIGAYEVRGTIVDPGPTSCLDTLLTGLEEEPRALMLTHIHLDHAGSAGSLVERFPGLRVYVHESGAPHLVNPEKLLESAGRLYGDDMDRLWGPVLPVPAANIVSLTGGETVEGFRVAHTPGHASHHVACLDSETGDAYVGDVAGVRIPPSEHTVAPTPPPDIDVEAWEGSLEVVRGWEPSRLCLTHFGRADDPPAQLDRVREALRRSVERALDRDRDAFLAATAQELEASADGEIVARSRQAAPPDQGWLGIERYLRKRDQSAT
jgi:glyoxylase-like metal-dependent hydrolase (beta-lactamase superfamily II)